MDCSLKTMIICILKFFVGGLLRQIKENRSLMIKKKYFKKTKLKIDRPNGGKNKLSAANKAVFHHYQQDAGF